MLLLEFGGKRSQPILAPGRQHDRHFLIARQRRRTPIRCPADAPVTSAHSPYFSRYPRVVDAIAWSSCSVFQCLGRFAGSRNRRALTKRRNSETMILTHEPVRHIAVQSTPPRPLNATRGVDIVEMPVRDPNRCTDRGCRFSEPSIRTGAANSDASIATRATRTTSSNCATRWIQTQIFVKRMAAQVLARTLSRTRSARTRSRSAPRPIPYSPPERKYRLTRSMLEVFAGLSGLSLSITTKSSLIVRDLDCTVAR